MLSGRDVQTLSCFLLIVGRSGQFGPGTVSGEQGGNAEQGTHSDAVILPTQDIRLADPQDMLQAMVDKAISDRTISQPHIDDSGKSVTSYCCLPLGQ